MYTGRRHLAERMFAVCEHMGVLISFHISERFIMILTGILDSFDSSWTIFSHLSLFLQSYYSHSFGWVCSRTFIAWSRNQY